MHEKLLEFGHMYANKTYFFCVFEMKIVFYFFWNLKEKPGIFNIRSVSYSVRLQPDIR
jgi:hypothetical protein